MDNRIQNFLFFSCPLYLFLRRDEYSEDKDEELHFVCVWELKVEGRAEN